MIWETCSVVRETDRGQDWFPGRVELGMCVDVAQRVELFDEWVQFIGADRGKFPVRLRLWNSSRFQNVK